MHTLLMILLACAPRLASPVSTLTPEATARVDTVGLRLLDECTRAALAVVLDGQVVYANAFGSEPSLETVHQWASVSKSATAVIAMRLVGEGKLTLDEPIPRFASMIPETRPTLGQLLSHTGGVTHQRHAGDARMFSKPPGSRWTYSTNGYGVVGQLVAHALGTTYSEAVRREIGERSGAPSLRVPYDTFAAPGAGIRSTILDLARFSASLINHDIVSSETFDRMTTPQAAGSDRRGTWTGTATASNWPGAVRRALPSTPATTGDRRRFCTCNRSFAAG